MTDSTVFYLMRLRLRDVSKRAGTRIQMRRAFSSINNLQDFDKSVKDFISSIKDKALKEEANKARSKFNTRVKDLIEGDNFFTNKPNPKYAKSDYTAKFNAEKWVNDMSGILSDEWVVNLKAMAKKHHEMFKSEADVFRVVKEIKDNPTHFFKNYNDKLALIAKPLKHGKSANIAIEKNSGKIVRVNKTKGKNLGRLSRRNKKMLTGTPLPATTKGSTTDVAGDLLQHSPEDSAQTTLKQSLMQISKSGEAQKTLKTQKAREALNGRISQKMRKILQYRPRTR